MLRDILLLNMNLKQAVKIRFPIFYGKAQKIKSAISPKKEWKSEAVFNGLGHYATPESSLYSLIISANIDTFFDIGCGAGRNLIPFDGKLKLWGTDIVPQHEIKWLRDFNNLRYSCLTLQQLTKELEAGKYDLTNTLVFTYGTLMCVSKKEQRRFFEAAKRSGATEFVFYEYPPTYKHSVGNFQLPLDAFVESDPHVSDDPRIRKYTKSS